MSVEAPQIGRISDAKVNSIAGFFGESTFHHISCGEEGNRAIVLVEDVYGA